MLNTETIKESIIKGIGVSILSIISVETEKRHGFLKTTPLKDANLSRKLYIIHKKNRVMLPEHDLFIQQVLSRKR